MEFVLALFRSFLPPRYRDGRAHATTGHLVAAAGFSGFLELVLCGLFYVKGFLTYTAEAVIGPAAFLEYFFVLKTAVLLFFVLDGGLRLLGSLTGQAIGTIPL